MNTKHWMCTAAIGAVVTVSLMIAGCGKRPQEEHGADDGHGHGKGPATEQPAAAEEHDHEAHAGPAGAIAAAERDTARCEHAMPTYQCDECRYEVGVVKVQAGMMKSGAGGLVGTQVVTRMKLPVVLATTAEVALNENAAVHISPRVAGIIQSVSADIGARVKAGDTLLTLVSVELGKALAEHERNRTLAALAENTYLREKNLRDAKVGSEQDMIEAQMVYENHRADLKASEQTLHVLGLMEDDLAAMRGSPHDLRAGQLPVRAPIAGTIIEKHAVPGETADPGKDLMLLADLSTVWVWVNVHARDLTRLLEAEKRGPVPVAIKVTAFPDRQFEGVVTYVGATMDERTRTVKVRATVRNPELVLRPGMFCEAALALGQGQAEDVLAVPHTVVLSDEGRDFVFKHWKDDYFVRQDVRKGRSAQGQVEILEGLQAGDTVVTDGAFLLKSDLLREKMGAGCAD